MGSFPIASRKRAFHWSLKPQCISGNVATGALYNNAAFLTAAGRLGSAIQLHHDARGQSSLAVNAYRASSALWHAIVPLKVSRQVSPPPQRSFTLDLISFSERDRIRSLYGALSRWNRSAHWMAEGSATGCLQRYSHRHDPPRPHQRDFWMRFHPRFSCFLLCGQAKDQ